MSPTKVARELTLVYALTCAVTVLLSRARGPLVAAHGSLLLAALFLLLALQMARRDPRGATFYGIDLAGVLEAREDEPSSPVHGLGHTLWRALPRFFSELGFALAVAALLFPPFVLAFCGWHGVRHGFTWHPPRDPVDFMLGQLFAVALPEEALFRGYFYTRLSELFPARRRVLGAELSLAALGCQGALFALLHYLVGFAPQRLAVFFPALVFGWMRARRGGIGAAVWFHAMCNLLAELLTRGYL